MPLLENLFWRGSLPGPTDNSNTQFATLGLWAARRHDLPLAPTFRLLVRRFEWSQSEDGTWSYGYRFGGANRHILSATNTGAGLLALAIGSTELSTESEINKRRAKQIVRGLAVLRGIIGEPTEHLVLREFGQPNYYLLWTIERVAGLYNLKTIGEHDWYRWGMPILLTNQNVGGDWPRIRFDVDVTHAGHFSSALNTSFALLFLKRSNLTKDLTEKMSVKPENLTKDIMSLPAGPAPKDSLSPGSATPKKQ